LSPSCLQHVSHLSPSCLQIVSLQAPCPFTNLHTESKGATVESISISVVRQHFCLINEHICWEPTCSLWTSCSYFLADPFM
jgi:hypothetical protein